MVTSVGEVAGGEVVWRMGEELVRGCAWWGGRCPIYRYYILGTVDEPMRS